MDRIPKPGEFYKHFKNKLYQVITVASHSETGEELVIYQALYGDFKTYARPLEMFTSEVDTEKYKKAEQKFRFEKVELRASSEQDTYGTSTGESQTALPNPYLLAFLDADHAAKRLEALTRMKGRVTQRELNNIYEVLDMQPCNGSLEEQLDVIEIHLRTLEKYDGRRLR